MTLRAILDCADASFDHYILNHLEWQEVRDACEELLHPDGLEGYERHLQEWPFDEDNREDWVRLLAKFNGEDEEHRDISMSDHEGMSEYHAEYAEFAEEARNKRIAFHQLQAWSEYLAKGETPVEAAGYNRFLVSVVFARFMCSRQISHALL